MNDARLLFFVKRLEIFLLIEIVHREIPRSEGSDEEHQRHIAGQVVYQRYQRLDADTSGAD